MVPLHASVGVRNAGDISQGIVPMQAVLATVNFRGCGTWPNPAGPSELTRRINLESKLELRAGNGLF